MSRGLRGRCGAGANRRPLAGGGASPSPSPARLAAMRGATRRREAQAPPEVPCGADHASFLSSIRDRERLSALSTFFFVEKTGLYIQRKVSQFTSFSLQRHHSKKRKLQTSPCKSTRLLSSPAAGEDALETTTLPTKKLQSLEMAPREAYRENQHAV